MNKEHDDAQLYHELGALLAEVPDLHDLNTPATIRWLARLNAVIREAAKYDVTAPTELNFAIKALDSDFLASPNRILWIANRVLAILERKAHFSSEGAFIPVGDVFSATMTVGRVIASASSSVLFIDPYAAANILSDYATHAEEGVSIQVLAGQDQVKPNLAGATRDWKAQYERKRPLEVRLAPAKTVHDRAIIIDDRAAWTIGTSFNAVATRAPTLLQKVGHEVFTDKLTAYRSIWWTASPIG